MFPFDLEITEKNFPSLYEDGEHPSELLQEINNKLDSKDKIIENQNRIIDKLQKQIDLAEDTANKANIESKSAKKQTQKSNILSIISILIAVCALIYEIIINLID